MRGAASERAIAISASRGSASRTGSSSGAVASDVVDPHAVAVHDHDRRGIARHERVPAPPLGALDALEQISRGPRPRARGTARRASRRRPAAPSTRGRAATGPRASRTRHDRASPADAVPRALLLVGTAGSVRGSAARERRNPGPTAGGCGGSRCERGTYGRAGMRLREPRRHVQVIPCIRIRRRLCLLSDGGVNDADVAAAILWNPCACPDCSCRRCARIPRKRRSRAIASCSAVGSCAR